MIVEYVSNEIKDFTKEVVCIAVHKFHNMKWVFCNVMGDNDY